MLCLDNTGYQASLEVGKLYRLVRPHPNDMRGWIRVIDESGEDYLFPDKRFGAVSLSPSVRRTLTAAIS